MQYFCYLHVYEENLLTEIKIPISVCQTLSAVILQSTVTFMNLSDNLSAGSVYNCVVLWVEKQLVRKKAAIERKLVHVKYLYSEAAA